MFGKCIYNREGQFSVSQQFDYYHSGVMLHHKCYSIVKKLKIVLCFVTNCSIVRDQFTGRRVSSHLLCPKTVASINICIDVILIIRSSIQITTLNCRATENCTWFFHTFCYNFLGRISSMFFTNCGLGNSYSSENSSRCFPFENEKAIFVGLSNWPKMFAPCILYISYLYNCFFLKKSQRSIS